MSVTRISALAGGLVLLAGALTGGSAQAALDSSSSAMVPVSITAAHNVTMPTTIQPGVNTFRVTTEATSSDFQLVQLAEGYTLEMAIADIDKGLDKGNSVKAIKSFEAHSTLLGGVPVERGKVGKLTVNLPPGNYYAADIERNRPSAFTAFTVAGADTGAAMPETGATLRAVKSASWAKKPKSIPHKGMLTFENRTDQNHFVELVKLNKGKTVGDFATWLEAQLAGKKAGPPPINFGVSYDGGVLAPGHTAVSTYKLPKGNYVLLCFWPDASMGGMPHAFMGMYRGIRLT